MNFFVFPLSHLMPVILVLIVGTVFSFVVFIAELIVKCLCKSKRKIIRSFEHWEFCVSIIAHIHDVDSYF